jgi:hypothetical protein
VLCWALLRLLLLLLVAAGLWLWDGKKLSITLHQPTIIQ